MRASLYEYKLKERRSEWINRKQPFKDRNNISKWLKRIKAKRERRRWEQGKDETYDKYKGFFW